MSEIDLLRESLRKVQQERDRYRSETARLRTENAKLQNDIDILFTRLSDLDDQQARTAADSVAQPQPDIGQGATSNSTHVLDHGDKCQHSLAASALGSGRAPPAGSSSSTRNIALKVEELEHNVVESSSDGGGGTYRKELKGLKRPRSPLATEDPRTAKRNRGTSQATVQVGSSTCIDNAPPMNVHDNVCPTSGTSVACLNEQCAAMATAGTKPLGRSSTPVPIMGPTNKPPSVHGNQAVAGPLTEHQPYQRYHTIPDQCLRLPPKKIQSYLKDAVCVPFQPSEGPISVSRYFLSESAYTNRGGVGELRLPLSSRNTSSKHVLIGNHSPYFPNGFGSPGLFISCLKEVLDNSRLWSCMALAPNLTSRKVVYLGEYRLTSVGTMTVEEYRNQKREAKTRTVRIMVSCKKGKQRGNKKSSKDARTEIAEAFAAGEEKVNILVMQFVHYDTHFAHTLRDAFKHWSEKKSHKDDGESARKGKRNGKGKGKAKDHTTSQHQGTKHQPKSVEEEEVDFESSEDESDDDEWSDSEEEN